MTAMFKDITCFVLGVYNTCTKRRESREQMGSKYNVQVLQKLII